MRIITLAWLILLVIALLFFSYLNFAVTTWGKTGVCWDNLLLLFSILNALQNVVCNLFQFGPV